ncbi:hypothetical protein [Herbaspirillum rubrisubalbicans]|uniref:hypothetical protein n=1 Tax=Herbaspirillum rubrisubalbicans TaxID=80842 RepID=UPI000DD300C2|nr:hypothetical protein [Herbaspirillum rubrisubalbicans]
MTSIDITSKLTALIRAQANVLQGPNQTAQLKRTATADKDTGAIVDDWLQQVASAIATISSDDPRRRSKAFRVYLASVISRELGISQVHGTEFLHLMDKVEATMQADKELKQAMDKAGDILLSQLKNKD